jgi:hypothetical protein
VLCAGALGHQPGVTLDRFITIAGLTVSGLWLVVLALVTGLQRF